MKALKITVWALSILLTALTMGLFIGATELETGQAGDYGLILFILVCVLIALSVRSEKA